MSENAEDGNERKKHRVAFGALIGLAIAAWFAYWFWIDVRYPTLQDRALFGDSFGAANALFSALAFAGLVYAILLQHHELSLQRQELAETRAEITGQKVQMEIQNSTLLLQSFEATFFQLVRLQNDIIAGIKVNTTFYHEGIEGRAAIGALRMELHRRYYFISENKGVDLLDDTDYSSLTSSEARAEAAYVGLYNAYSSELGHYFRNLYNLFRFVHESNVSRKNRYAGFARAQLSNDELVILFYNCLGREGRTKFKSLVEEYAIFDNLPDGLLLDEVHRELYAPGAFGEGTPGDVGVAAGTEGEGQA